MENYPVEKPALIAPGMVEGLSDEQRATFSTLDKLAQIVIPRLVDRLVFAEWKVGKLEWELENLRKSLPQEAPAVITRRKSSYDKTRIGIYDSKKRKWFPKIFEGVEVTGSFLDVYDDLDSPETKYSSLLVAFVESLTFEDREQLHKLFG